MTLLGTLLEAAEANANQSEAWATLRTESQTRAVQGAADHAKTFADAALVLVHAAAELTVNGLHK